MKGFWKTVGNDSEVVVGGASLGRLHAICKEKLGDEMV